MPKSRLGHFRQAAISPCVGPFAARRLQNYFRRRQPRNNQPRMTSIGVMDGLVSTVLEAVQCLPTAKQAAILLDTSLALIEAGQCGAPRFLFPPRFNSSPPPPDRYGPKVEEFLEVYLNTPGIPQQDVTKALLARGAARRAAAERLMAKAKQGTKASYNRLNLPQLIERVQTSTLYPESILLTVK